MHDRQGSDVLIDCDTCVAPAHACAGCVMTVLLRGSAGPPAGRAPRTGTVDLDEAERAAIDSLSRAGLVPPLRLVHGVSEPEPDLGEPADGSGGGPPRASRGIA